MNTPTSHRIGFVGGGQLGRMLGLAAKSMGFYVTVIDPTPNSPAGQVVDRQIIADFKDEEAIRELASLSDFLTFEIELANAAILDEVAGSGVKVNPSAITLSVIKDKFLQKQFLHKAQIPTAESKVVETQEDIKKAGSEFGYPLLLKARLDAYDGKGNALIKHESDIPGAMAKLKHRTLYIEKFVPFTKELAVMVARSTTGEIVSYPVVETIHKNNICHTVIAPAEVSVTVKKKAQHIAEKTMKSLKGAGVFGIEMFLTKKGEVLVNEIAPRVHNSGHYTTEACVTSQFEQHIRAVTGLPLGSTDMIAPHAVMVNILGDRQGKAQVKGLDKALAIPGLSVHIYGKEETKIERKMGHITAIDKTASGALKKAVQARAYIHI
jgi:5-(carboxyamino)imidazole ribonucleotide synthase